MSRRIRRLLPPKSYCRHVAFFPRPNTSLLFTSSLLWSDDCKNMKEYYKKCVGVELPPLPTVLGLKLAVDLELGSKYVRFKVLGCYKSNNPLACIHAFMTYILYLCSQFTELISSKMPTFSIVCSMTFDKEAVSIRGFYFMDEAYNTNHKVPCKIKYRKVTYFNHKSPLIHRFSGTRTFSLHKQQCNDLLLN